VQLAKRREAIVTAIAGKEKLAKTFPLERIVDAQRAFIEKKHVGKFVLIPPPLDGTQPAFSATEP
jgi:hypothetical protein